MDIQRYKSCRHCFPRLGSSIRKRYSGRLRSLKKLFPQVNFYQVLIDRDPQTAQIYDIQTSPTTMFIPLTGKPLFIPGFLTPEEAKEKTEFLIEGRTKQIIKNDCI